MSSIHERLFFNHIKNTTQDILSDDVFQGTTLRWKKDYLGISWLNTFGYCEYKFEFAFNRDGIPVEDYITSLPPDIRETEQTIYTESVERKEEGITTHTLLADRIATAKEKQEIKIGCPYIGIYKDGTARGVRLLGRMDYPHYDPQGHALHITDWKTGDPPLSNDPWLGDVLQLLGYCYAVRYILSQSPEFNDTNIIGHITYTRSGQEFHINYDSHSSVVRPGFSQFRLWSPFTPAGLIADKLLTFWGYWAERREAWPTKFKNKCVKCEYRSACPHSPFRQAFQPSPLIRKFDSGNLS